MTSETLREMVAAATEFDYLGPDPNDMDGEKWGTNPEAEARLAALAPSLAEHLADAMEALAEIEEMPVEESSRNGWTREMQKIARAALTRFSELGGSE